jgi:glutamate dehydrogenase/leucine dehydrogenase
MESIKGNNRIFSKSFQNPLLCALGAVINDETIPKLKCKIVAGSAANRKERETSRKA